MNNIKHLISVFSSFAPHRDSRVKENGDCEKSFGPFRHAKYLNVPDVTSSSCLMASNSLKALSPPTV